VTSIDLVYLARNPPPESLFFDNNAGFPLAMAIADNPLFGYESREDVWKQEIPDGDDKLVLRFKDSVLERIILGHYTKTGGVTDKPMPRSACKIATWQGRWQ
jgi:hypothetical protein